MDIAVVGLVGIILGAIIGIGGTVWTTRATLHEQRRASRRDYLVSRMDMLTEALAEYEALLSSARDIDLETDGNLQEKYARVVGNAIAACLSISDLPSPNDISDEGISKENIPEVPYELSKKTHKIHRLSYIANKRLTRNLVTEKDNPQEYRMWGDFRNRNRHALDHAVKRLAQLIAAEYKR